MNYDKADLVDPILKIIDKNFGPPPQRKPRIPKHKKERYDQDIIVPVMTAKENKTFSQFQEGALAVVGKAAMAVAKGAGKVAKAGSKVAKSGSKVVNPKVMGGEVKKSAQIAKKVKPKSGTTIDVDAVEVGGEIAKKKKQTMNANSSTPSTKYPKNKQQDDLSGGGSLAKTDKKKPEAEKPKEDKPKKKVIKAKKKGTNKIKQGIEAIDKAYGTTSFTVKEQKTFTDFILSIPLQE